MHVPQTQSQLRIRPTRGTGRFKKAPACPVPTPSNSSEGYTLYGTGQRLADGELVGYTEGGSGRRELTSVKDEARASACQALCSGARYTPIFYFSVEKTGDGACYCSQDRCGDRRCQE